MPIGCDLGRGPPNGRRRKAVAAAVRRRWGRIRLSARRSVCEVPFAAAGWQAPQAHSVSSARLTACVPFVIVHRSPRRSEIGGVVLLPRSSASADGAPPACAVFCEWNRQIGDFIVLLFSSSSKPAAGMGPPVDDLHTHALPLREFVSRVSAAPKRGSPADPASILDDLLLSQCASFRRPEPAKTGGASRPARAIPSYYQCVRVICTPDSLTA